MGDLYKTALCRVFEKDGSCPLGAECRYAHGKREIRATLGSKQHGGGNDRDDDRMCNDRSGGRVPPPVSLPPVDNIHVLHDFENLPVAADVDVVRLKDELVARATYKRPPREHGGAPAFEWHLYCGKLPDDRAAANLRHVGANLIPCGPKKNSVDTKLKEEAHRELDTWREHPKRGRLVVLLASNDSDFAAEVRMLQSAGVRVGVVCKRDVNKVYRDQADFYVLWEDVLPKCGHGVGGGGQRQPPTAASAAAQYGGTRSQQPSGGGGTGDLPGADALRRRWCDAICSQLAKVFDEAPGGRVLVAALGQEASRLRPAGGEGLKLEAALGDDGRFVVSKDKDGATFVKLRGRSGAGGAGGGRSGADGEKKAAQKAAELAQRAAQKARRGADIDLDELRDLWCDAIVDHLVDEEELEEFEGIALSSLGQIARQLRPPGGEGLKLEASLRADGRFLIEGEGSDKTVIMLQGEEFGTDPFGFRFCQSFGGQAQAREEQVRQAAEAQHVAEAMRRLRMQQDAEAEAQAARVQREARAREKAEAEQRAEALRAVHEASQAQRAAEVARAAAVRDAQALARAKTPAVPVQNGRWVDRCKEGDLAAFKASTRVRYGADVRWIELTISMSFPFKATNEAFRGDPAPGTQKRVQEWVVG